MLVFAGRLPEVLRLEAARLVRVGGRGGGAEDVDQVVGVDVLHLVLGPRGGQRLCNGQEINICVFPRTTVRAAFEKYLLIAFCHINRRMSQWAGSRF